MRTETSSVRNIGQSVQNFLVGPEPGYAKRNNDAAAGVAVRLRYKVAYTAFNFAAFVGRACPVNS